MYRRYSYPILIHCRSSLGINIGLYFHMYTLIQMTNIKCYSMLSDISVHLLQEWRWTKWHHLFMSHTCSMGGNRSSQYAGKWSCWISFWVTQASCGQALFCWNSKSPSHHRLCNFSNIHGTMLILLKLQWSSLCCECYAIYHFCLTVC